MTIFLSMVAILEKTNGMRIRKSMDVRQVSNITFTCVICVRKMLHSCEYGKQEVFAVIRDEKWNAVCKYMLYLTSHRQRTVIKENLCQRTKLICSHVYITLPIFAAVHESFCFDRRIWDFFFIISQHMTKGYK